MVSVGRKIVRSLLVGSGIGLLGGAGIYLMCKGLNILAGYNVVDPIGFTLMIVGGITTMGIGVGLSDDIASDEAKEPG